jgi:hypothetical protein
MALGRFVITAAVTITPDVAATVTAGEPGTGGAAGYGGAPRVAPGTSGKYDTVPLMFTPGTVIVADSSAGSTGPQLLYAAIGAGNLRAFVDGQDTVGHAALGN